MLPSMEIRRAQITGGSSFMITLPKSWAESVGLKKNDPISLIPQPNGGLLLTVNGTQEQENSLKTIDVGTTRDAEALYRYLIGAYIAGHDQILVRSDSSIKGAFLEAVSKFTQTSIGMEIVEEEEDRILIKDLMDHTEIQPQKNVRREYLLVKRMISEIFSSTRVPTEEMEARDTEVDRIHWLVRRQSSIHQQDINLSNRMGIDLRSVTNCVSVSKTLERMGDHVVLLNGHLQTLDDSSSKSISVAFAELSESIRGYVDKSMAAWFDADDEGAEMLISVKSDIMEKIRKTFAGISNVESKDMIEGSCIRLIEYCTDIAESAIDIAMEKT